VQTVTVYFPSGAQVFAELADRAETILRGLSHRTEVPEGTGMLFDMGSVARHLFWMRDTWVSLDMVFLDPEGTVVGIVEGALPGDPTLLGVATPSRYVLEVAAGWSGRHGVAVGQRAQVVALPDR
jgi:uncharacterized membrane protein (UPF0127 family)